jgi:NAD(P)H-quinone oxidoreductase subunit L
LEAVLEDLPQARLFKLPIYLNLSLINMSLLLSAPVFYAAIAGAYLFVIPLLLLFYFKARWYKTGSIERILVCLFAFFFFPGLLVLSPFFNFRPLARQI